MTYSGSVNLGYDVRGNLTTEQVGANPPTNTYSYDPENRLIGLNGVTTLAYDAMERLSKVTQGSVVTQYLYDGVNRIAEYDGSGQVLRRYVHGAGTDEPLAWFEYQAPAGHPVRHLVANQQGSIVAVTGASGASIAVNTYDEYGAPGAGNMGAFQYTGQTWMPQVNLYHYKARAYSPFLGRFMQTDPIGYGDGMNWYAYADDDPINRSDPTGLAAFALPGFLIAAGEVTGTAAAGAFTAVAAPVVAFAGALFMPSRMGADDVCPGGVCGSPVHHNNQNQGAPPGTPGSDRGCIYCVPGDRTNSGKPYVGSADDLGRRTRGARDGRDRTGADVIGDYSKGDGKAVKMPSRKV